MASAQTEIDMTRRTGLERRAVCRETPDRRIVDLATHLESFVTVDELAAYWRVSRDVIYRDIDKGALIAWRVGRLIRIRLDDARRYGQPVDCSSL